jgi:ABC-2 type transport system ATP-binding protein
MIEASDVHFSYKRRKRWFRPNSKQNPVSVLNGINLTIGSNQLFGLIGPNGSGKTTLAKLLLGAYEPDQGELKYNGANRPSLNNSAWKQKIGWLSGASSRLFSTITLVEHIELYRSVYRFFDEQWFNTILDGLGIAGHLHKRPTALSFGERIKFEVAITLAYKPEVLILDEPTVGLDPLAIEQVRKLVQSYMDQRAVCGLLTSHNLKDITELCSSGAFLHQGILIDPFESRHLASAALLEEKYREVYSHEG